MPHDHLKDLLHLINNVINDPNETDIITVSRPINSSIECLIKIIALEINKFDKLLKDIKTAFDDYGNRNGNSNNNGNPWSALQTSGGSNGVNGFVNSIALDTNGNIYAGGTFTDAGGIPVKNIAIWNSNSETWSALGERNGVNGTVNSIAIDKTTGKIYVGGSFTEAGGVTVNNIAMWNSNSGWSALQTSGGSNGINGTVNAIAIDATGTVYVGGSFTDAGGIAVKNIATWNSNSGWSALGGSNGVNGTVNAIALDATGNVYVGGTFTNAGGVPVNNIASWTSNLGWSALGGSNGVNGTVNAIALDATGNVYVGGAFTKAGEIQVYCIALWNQTQKIWSDIGFDSQGILLQGTYISTIAIDNSNNMVYVGGNIKPVGNFINSQYIAKLDTISGIWKQLTSGCNNYVNTIATDLNNRIYVGGLFTESGGIPTNYISTYSS